MSQIDNGLRGRDKDRGDLRNKQPERDTPEGLERSRKGPVNKDTGRKAQIDATEQPPSPGEPAGGE